MNLPIRPEAAPLDLPIPTPTSDKASKPAEAGNFAAVLNQELGQSGTSESSEAADQKKESDGEKKEPPKVTADPWTLFGIAPATLQLIQATVPSVPIQSNDSSKSLVPQLAQPPPGPASAAASAPAKVEAEPKEPAAPTDEREVVLDKLIAGLHPGGQKASDQQKIPEFKSSTPDISVENAPKPAKEALKPNGILVAQEPLMLRPSPKQDEIASSGKGNVHARNDVPNPEPVQHETRQAAAEVRKISILNEAPGQKREEQPIKIDFSASESFSVQKHDGESVAPSELTPVHTSSVDSVIETIHNHVQFLRYTGNERLELVFRPDKDTQLFIQVAKVNGQIQVQARWDRGELNQVTAHWSQVQQSLATQGIRVEPLGQGSNLSTPLNSHLSGQKQQQNRDDSRDKLIPLENAVPAKTKTSASRSSSVRRGGGGWQGWA